MLEADAGSALDALYHQAGPMQQVFCLLDTDCDGACTTEDQEARALTAVVIRDVRL